MLFGDGHTANYNQCKKRLEFVEQQNKIKQFQAAKQRSRNVVPLDSSKFPGLPQVSSNPPWSRLQPSVPSVYVERRPTATEPNMHHKQHQHLPADLFGGYKKIAVLKQARDFIL